MAPVERREEEGEVIWEDELQFEDLFEPQDTYIYFTIDLSHPVVPKAGPAEPKPDEIVPVKNLVRWPFSKVSTDDFQKQIAIAIKSLTREYYSSFKQKMSEDAL